jgi:hypothetical protein
MSTASYEWKKSKASSARKIECWILPKIKMSTAYPIEKVKQMFNVLLSVHPAEIPGK